MVGYVWLLGGRIEGPNQVVNRRGIVAGSHIILDLNGSNVLSVGRVDQSEAHFFSRGRRKCRARQLL